MTSAVRRTKTLTFVLLTVTALSLFSVAVPSGSDASVANATEDAAGNAMKDDYGEPRIVTVGVGTLRWVSYFGYEDYVVCIDGGDANASSWNGKAYRSLFDFPPEFVSKITGTCAPTWSDYEKYGIAAHDHNGFSTANLESIHAWDIRPTVMVVTDSVYGGFAPEHIDGIEDIMDIVVIEEVDQLFGDGYELSEEFVKNLGIFATLFGDSARATEIENSIVSIIDDIRGLIHGKSSKFKSAYVGGTSQSGSKALSWSVGDYLPFALTDVENAFDGSGTVAVDGGSEVMSVAVPSVIFMDLSTGKNYNLGSSEGVLAYANYNKVPIYTILPYFWFGYNFDNALADAYLMVYACYDGILTFGECLEKIVSVYESFYPNMENGRTALDGFAGYYAKQGSSLTFDGQSYLYNGSDFVATERPSGDTGAPGGGKERSDALILGAVVSVVAVLAAGSLFMIFRKR